MESFRILGLRAENFTRLHLVDITPGQDQNIVEITGRNGAGKSSVLDALTVALCGTRYAPPVPVHRGEASAEIEIDLGKYKVKRSFQDGKSTLRVTSATGAKYSSPQALLDELIGDLAFDPARFLNLPPKEQVGRLLEVCPSGFDFAEADRNRQGLYDQRTLENRTAERHKGSAANMTDVPDTAPEPVSIAALLEQRRELQAQDTERQALVRHAAKAQGALAKIEADIIAHEAKMEEMRQAYRAAKLLMEQHQTALVAAQADAQLTRQTADEYPPVDFNVIEQRIEDAESTNHQYAEWQKRQEYLNDQSVAESRAAELTRQIEAIDRAKRQALAEARLPVPGLSFTAEGITLHDLPLASASTAEKLRVAIALAMAKEPKLRVVIIREGSLLDSNSRTLLEQLAQEYDFQAWVETVDGEVGIIIDDGYVAEVRNPRERTRRT